MIAIGNSGAGKSTFLNSIAEDFLFESGTSRGYGLTSKVSRARSKTDNNLYIDTPGLGDPKHGRNAWIGLEQVFTEEIELRILFFIRQRNGRITREDIKAMDAVLELHSEIGSNFGIIVNYSDKDFLKELFEKDEKLDEFLKPIFLELKPTNHTERILLLPEVQELNRKSNIFVRSSDIHPYLQLFLDQLPTVKTKPGKSEVKKQSTQLNEFNRLEEARNFGPFHIAKKGLEVLFSDI